MRPCPECRGRRPIHLNPLHAVLPIPMRLRAGVGFTQGHCRACDDSGMEDDFAREKFPPRFAYLPPNPRLVGSGDQTARAKAVVAVGSLELP